jgi:hypothetical protein
VSDFKANYLNAITEAFAGKDEKSCQKFSMTLNSHVIDCVDQIFHFFLVKSIQEAALNPNSIKEDN